MKKKILVILGIFIIILLFVVYLLYNYRKGVAQAQSFNKQYENYYEKTILGTDLATVMNKAMDYNQKSDIAKDSNDRYYIETEKSLLVEVKFLEKEETVKMEDILLRDMENFINFYATASFKCTKIEYHQENKQVKNLYFEQIESLN